jgi:peptidyl-prolyl cis-trans isomerase A (cyclophilin A)
MKHLILSLFVIFTLANCTSNKTTFNKKWVTKEAPEKYVARFETTKGLVDIEVERKLSPKAADRFYQLVKYHYFDDATFYRVIPNFVAQFGNNDTIINNEWKKYKIEDEPVIAGNKKGALSFARAGKETRDLDLFINLKDNHRLDTINSNGVKGFPAFGQVIKGMDIVEKFYDGYAGETMKDDEIFNNKQFMRQKYPKLDRIIKTKIIKLN